MSFCISAKSVAPSVVSSEDDYPDHFLCPITYEVMHDPVQDPSGHVYERQALLRALGRNPVSPLTRQPLRSEELQPADALRAEIAAHPGAALAAAKAAAERLKLWAAESSHPRAPEPALTAAEVRDLDWLEPPMHAVRPSRAIMPPAWQRPMTAMPRPRGAWPYRFIDPPAPRWRRIPAPRAQAPTLPWLGTWANARSQWVGLF